MSELNLTTVQLLTQIKTWVTDDQMPQKEDVIDDLATIRAGAAAGGTAYQLPQMGVPNSDLAGNIAASKLAGDIPAAKLAQAVQALLTAAGTALQPSDLTELTNRVSALEALINPGGIVDPDDVINKFNEIVAFLAGIPETTLAEILAGISAELATKYVKPEGGIPKTDMASDVQSSLGAADTAVQYTETEGTTDQDLIDEYQRVLNALYQALSDVESEKADYVGTDNYVYHFNRQTRQYEKTNLFVKGDPGTTDYNQLQNKPDLKRVATTGDYNDLTNKPELKPVATSGSYNDLQNKPFIPTALSQMGDDGMHRTVTDGEKDTWNSKANGTHTHTKNQITDFSHTHTKSDITDFAHTHDLKDLGDDTGHRTVSDTEKQTWGGKQDAISDLATIRSGAQAGSTAYQKPTTGIPASDLALDAVTYEEADCTSLLN